MPFYIRIKRITSLLILCLLWSSYFIHCYNLFLIVGFPIYLLMGKTVWTEVPWFCTLLVIISNCLASLISHFSFSLTCHCIEWPKTSFSLQWSISGNCSSTFQPGGWQIRGKEKGRALLLNLKLWYVILLLEFHIGWMQQLYFSSFCLFANSDFNRLFLCFHVLLRPAQLL